MALLRARLSNALFAHWPVDPEIIETRLPESLSVCTHDGRAWLGIVVLRMGEIRPPGVPRDWGRSLWQYNLRSYVRRGDRQGVYFFSLDADDWLSARIARGVFGLPYHSARISAQVDNEVSVRGQRERDGSGLQTTYHPDGEGFDAPERELTAFSLERYRWYARSERGTLFTGTINHDPWRVACAEATISVDGLFAASKFEPPEGDPVTHVASPCPITVESVGPARLTRG